MGSNEMKESLPRRELLGPALKNAHVDYACATLQASDGSLEAHAEPETTILFSWVKTLLHEPGWFEQWLAAIAHRGVRSKADRAILTLRDQGVDVAALTDLVAELQLDVANGFFGIHSGSYCFALDPKPTLRVTLHYRWKDADGETLAAGEFPNAIDDDFMTFLFGNR
jgi:hypothetical protein